MPTGKSSAAHVEQQAKARRSGALAALGHRDFRLFLLGLVVSQTGTWMQLVAEGWLVYRLTNSAFTLGLVQFAAMIPLAPLTLVGGALADRLPRRTLLTLVQVAQVFPPVVLAALTRTGYVQVWHVVFVSVIMVALAAIDQPTRLALVAEVTDAESLDTGMALSASGLNVARVAGPAVAGVLVASMGEAVCFALNGLSFLAVTGALLAMRFPKREMTARRGSLRADLVGGGRYLAHEPILVAIMSVALIASLFVLPYQTLLPIFARDILGVGALGLGLLTTASGVGAILGGIAMTWLTVIVPGRRGAILTVLGLVVPIVVLGFAFSRSFVLSCLVLVLVAAGVLALKTLAFTIVQVQVPDELRGRMTSILLLLVQSAVRTGGLGAGYLADRLSAPLALALGALGCLISVLGLSAFVPQLRQVS